MKRKKAFYEKYIKRGLDILCALLAIIVLGWLYVLIAILVKIKLGSPIIYVTERVGKIDDETGKEKSFKLYKFRSMTNAVDKEGVLLPDVERLTKFGRMLRSTSLDELPEVFNILKGDMSLIGPRPLPSVYLPYYTEKERRRHDVRPGLSGYAQVNGRNSISWDDKFKLDLYYIEHISFVKDFQIMLKTVAKTVKRTGIGQGEKMPNSLYNERSYKVDERK